MVKLAIYPFGWVSQSVVPFPLVQLPKLGDKAANGPSGLRPSYGRWFSRCRACFAAPWCGARPQHGPASSGRRSGGSAPRTAASPGGPHRCCRETGTQRTATGQARLFVQIEQLLHCQARLRRDPEGF